jgi:hypothetical protein
MCIHLLFRKVEQQKKSEVTPLAPLSAELLDEYNYVFGEPSALPPRRDEDHRISLPLVAQLVKTKP